MLRIMSITTAFLLSTPAVAQHAHGNVGMPTETGQATFAAIAEIVAVLIDDPTTDWAKADIDGLREHLLDMDRVMMDADVQLTSDSNIVEFVVTGADTAAQSIQRMTMAHSPMLAAETGWIVQTTPVENGAVMRVQMTDPNDFQKVSGLGFFGVMTIGAHHQQHHLQIARGGNPHR